MTFMTKTAGLAALLATTVSGAALAQSGTVSGSVGANVGSGNAELSSGASASADVTAENNSAATGDAGASTSITTDGKVMVSKKLTYDDVVASLRNGTNVEADIRGVTADTSIQAVTLTGVEGVNTASSADLEAALAEAEPQLTTMRDMIDSNDEFRAMLSAQGYAVTDVIGIYQTADGAVEVLVDDRS